MNQKTDFYFPFCDDQWNKKREWRSLSVSFAATILMFYESSLFFIDRHTPPETSVHQAIKEKRGATVTFIFADKTVLITSDAELITTNLNNHIPNVTNGKSIHFYNSRCCHPIEVPSLRGSYKVHMYPMGTIGATIKTWKEIMGFNETVFSQ